MAFALARSVGGLLPARLLIGSDPAACLVAPLTRCRHHLGPAAQMQANPWRLKTGPMGMLAQRRPGA